MSEKEGSIKAAASWLAEQLSCILSQHRSSTWNKGHWEENGCPTKEMKEELLAALEWEILTRINRQVKSSVDTDRWDMMNIADRAANKCGLSKHSFNLSTDIVGMSVGLGRVTVWWKRDPLMPRSISEVIYPAGLIDHEEPWPPEVTDDLYHWFSYKDLEYSAESSTRGESFADIAGFVVKPSPFIRQQTNPRPWEGDRKRKLRR